MTGLLLLAAHLLGDFWLQTGHMAQFKLVDWRVRTWHVGVYSACFVPVLAWLMVAGDLDPVRAAAFFGLMAVAHWLTDCRRWASADWPPKPILVDQAFHVTQLAVLGALFLT